MGGDDLASRPHDALGDCRILGKEGVRDLGGSEAADRPQRQRYLRCTRERGVAPGEHQAKPIIWLAGDRMLQLCQLRAVASVTAQLVEGVASGNGHQPGTRSLWNALNWPALQRDQQRILDDFLRNVKISQYADQGRREMSGLLPEHSCKGVVRLGHG